ncbi:hypothetical protein TK43_17905 [Roseovarius sp. JS7-11]|nr:hypothetical protein TK43_17905 [Roseovarius sp. JS7-11]
MFRAEEGSFLGLRSAATWLSPGAQVVTMVAFRPERGIAMPPLEPTFPLGDVEDISGSFELQVVARFDDLTGGYWQRLIDIGSGAGGNNILLTQVENTGDIMFALYQDGTTYSVIAPGAILEGETATWTVGIDQDGLMWLDRDGVRLGQTQAVVPDDSLRPNELLGQSNWADDSPLIGAILGVDITNAGDVVDGGRLNIPEDINGAFQVDAVVRFDDLRAGEDQTVFTYGNADNGSAIRLFRVADSNDIRFEIVEAGQLYSVTAPDAISEGAWAMWSVGTDTDGTIWIERDSVRLVDAAGTVPTGFLAEDATIGAMGSAGGGRLNGVVLDLTVSTPLDGTGGADPVDPVMGVGDMIFVAHQDDDLLFMNPTIDRLIDGPDPVSVVYLTAGDAGQDEGYWAAREEGERAAYGQMAGANDWVDETVTLTVGNSQFEVASSYLASQPDIRLYFLRLPDGFSQGEGSEVNNFESLEQLWDGDIATITAVDGSATYTHADLVGLLSALLDQHQPDHIHLQDHTTDYADIEHSDHLHSAEFVTAALNSYAGDLTVTGYVGYASWGLDENLTADEEALVREFFAQYSAFDPNVLGSDGAFLEAYEEWVQREYIAYEYTLSGTGGGGPSGVTNSLSDLTGDGTDDILWRNGTTGQYGMFDMSGGTPTWSVLGQETPVWQISFVGDFDGDGTDDILWRNETTGGTGMFAMGSGIPVWNGLGTAGSEWQIMGVGDFNGDGTDDILWQNSTTGGVGMFAMSGGSSSWQGIGGSSAPWEIVATGDITGDGIDDIIWRNATTGQVGQFEMSSSGTPTWSAVANASTDWRLVGTGDFDGDGTDDLLWRHEASGAVGMYAMGSGSPVWQGLGQASFDWDIVGVGDYNGDGTDDILWRNVNTGTVGMYDMDGGTPSWQTIGQAGLDWDVEGQFVDEFVF